MALGIRTTGAPPPPQPRRAKRAPVPPIKAAPLKVDHPPHQITTATTTTTMTTTHPRSTIGDPDGSPALAAAASVLQQSMPRATKTDSGHRPLPCDYRSSGRTEPSSRRRDDAEPQATATRGGAAVITMNKSIRSVWTRDVSGEVVDNGLPSPRDGSSLEGDAGDAAFHAGSQMDGEGVLDQSEEDILKDEPFTSGKKTFTIGVMQQHHYNQNGSNVEATRALYPPYSRSRTRATTPPLLRTVSRSSVRPPPYSSSASIAPSGLHACPPLSPGSAWKEAARCAKQAERAERCMSILNQVLHLHERLRVCEGELRGIFAVMTEEMKTERQYFLDMTK